MDPADEADASMIYYQTQPSPLVKRHWDILVQLGGEEWMELKVEGSGADAADKIEEYIDPQHDRWARGYDGKLVRSNGPEASEAWNKVFGRESAKS